MTLPTSTVISVLCSSSLANLSMLFSTSGSYKPFSLPVSRISSRVTDPFSSLSIIWVAWRTGIFSGSHDNMSWEKRSLAMPIPATMRTTKETPIIALALLVEKSVNQFMILVIRVSEEILVTTFALGFKGMIAMRAGKKIIE